MCKTATDSVLEYLRYNPYISPNFSLVIKRDDSSVYKQCAIYKACRELHAQGKIRRIKIKGEKVSYGRLNPKVVPHFHFDVLEALDREAFPLYEVRRKEIIGLGWYMKFLNWIKK